VEALVCLGIAFVLLIAYLAFSPPSYPGSRVPSAMIPPPVIVSITHSNSPARAFPGIGGALIVLPDGSLWQWGQTGPGNWPRAAVPVQVGTNCDWVEAVVANNHCMGLRKGGTLWEWGWRGDSGPGGTARLSNVPEQADPRNDWVDIAAGDVHSVALRRDGTLWAWGDNSDDQLGNGPGPNQTNFVQVGTNRDWIAISAPQGSHSFALRKDGTLWVWGQISWFRNGQPGTGVFPFPTKVCRETNWVGFGGSGEARTRHGELWNLLNSTPDANAAAASNCDLFMTNWVPDHFARAFIGEPTFYEVRPNGTLWAETLSYSRRLNRLGHSNRWRQVGKRSDWVSIWGTSGTAVGLTSDGTIWMWGSDLGQAPVMDLPSRFKVLKARMMGWLGPRPTSLTTSANYLYQKEPRPLLVVTRPF